MGEDGIRELAAPIGETLEALRGGVHRALTGDWRLALAPWQMRAQRPSATIAEQMNAPTREGSIMVRYWYSLTPLVVILTFVPLALPWLGLIALMLFALIAFAALGALVWGIVLVPRMLVRSAGRRLHSRSGPGRQPALSAARPRVGPAQSMPAGAAALLATPPPDSERLT